MDWDTTTQTGARTSGVEEPTPRMAQNRRQSSFEYTPPHSSRRDYFSLLRMPSNVISCSFSEENDS